jgi:hypothetical protein
VQAISLVLVAAFVVTNALVLRTAWEPGIDTARRHARSPEPSPSIGRARPAAWPPSWRRALRPLRSAYSLVEVPEDRPAIVTRVTL